MQREYSVGVAIITYKAVDILEACIKPILASEIHPRIVVVNSSSNDGTVELAKKLGADTLIIPRNEFNHGATRDLARSYLATDIVVMMTPDAIPTSSNFLSELLSPIYNGEAAIAYSRQIPNFDSTVFESFPREFNYPIKSELRGLQDLNILGAYTYFSSDTCCAYLNKTIDEVGGFPSMLVSEDTFIAAKILNKGYKIAYVAESIVMHSHKYKLKQEFKRYFDIGYVRGLYQKELFNNLKDEGRGYIFFKALLNKIIKENILLLPYAFVQTAIKYLGYRVGFYGQRLPVSIKKCFSGQDFYWESILYDKEHHY